MTDLTDKWKKGELPEGWYYIEGNRVEGIYAYTAEYLNNMYRPRNGERIIAKVPSYEELQNINKSMNDLMATNIKLVEENKQLKELLRKAKGIITAYRLTGNQSTYSNDNMKECVAQIEQALGEE